jgi:hypothetical protein
LPKQARYRDEEGEEGTEEESLGSGSAKRVSRFAHLLRTSLALVKGELGTRSTAAHYTMVYGGLQGVHVALTAFDKKLATKASAARVDELVTDTNIC